MRRARGCRAGARGGAVNGKGKPRWRRRRAEAPPSPKDWKYDALFAAQGRLRRLHELLVELLRAKLAEALFLPFEANQMLSVILSKALLLADDTKIIDPTILAQVKR